MISIHNPLSWIKCDYYHYDYEERDQIDLLEQPKRLPCPVMVSGYVSALYDEMLGGWNTTELQVMNQAGVRSEKLWVNYELERFQWARYAGKNFTDRQRIKRKAGAVGKKSTGHA